MERNRRTARMPKSKFNERRRQSSTFNRDSTKIITTVTTKTEELRSFVLVFLLHATVLVDSALPGETSAQSIPVCADLDSFQCTCLQLAAFLEVTWCNLVRHGLQSKHVPVLVLVTWIAGVRCLPDPPVDQLVVSLNSSNSLVRSAVVHSMTPASTKTAFYADERLDFVEEIPTGLLRTRPSLRRVPFHRFLISPEEAQVFHCRVGVPIVKAVFFPVCPRGGLLLVLHVSRLATVGFLHLADLFKSGDQHLIFQVRVLFGIPVFHLGIPVFELGFGLLLFFLGSPVVNLSELVVLPMVLGVEAVQFRRDFCLFLRFGLVLFQLFRNFSLVPASFVNLDR